MCSDFNFDLLFQSDLWSVTSFFVNEVSHQNIDSSSLYATESPYLIIAD